MLGKLLMILILTAAILNSEVFQYWLELFAVD